MLRHDNLSRRCQKLLLARCMQLYVALRSEAAPIIVDRLTYIYFSSVVLLLGSLQCRRDKVRISNIIHNVRRCRKIIEKQAPYGRHQRHSIVSFQSFPLCFSHSPLSKSSPFELSMRHILSSVGTVISSVLQFSENVSYSVAKTKAGYVHEAVSTQYTWIPGRAECAFECKSCMWAWLRLRLSLYVTTRESFERSVHSHSTLSFQMRHESRAFI